MPTVIMSPTVEDWNSLCCLKGQDQEQYVEIMGNISYFDIEEDNDRPHSKSAGRGRSILAE